MKKLIELLDVRRGKWRKIACLAGVSPSMVTRIMSGYTKQPGYASVEQLMTACRSVRPTRRAK